MGNNNVESRSPIEYRNNPAEYARRKGDNGQNAWPMRFEPLPHVRFHIKPPPVRHRAWQNRDERNRLLRGAQIVRRSVQRQAVFLTRLIPTLQLQRRAGGGPLPPAAPPLSKPDIDPPDRCLGAALRADARPASQSPIFKAWINASCGISTFPNWRIRFLPSFCLSSSLRLRETSPP